MQADRDRVAVVAAPSQRAAAGRSPAVSSRMDRAGLIEVLTTAFTARPDVVEVALAGSLAQEAGDAHSDVDLLVTVAADGDVGAVNAAVPDILHAACEPVLIRVFPFVITFVTRE